MSRDLRTVSKDLKTLARSKKSHGERALSDLAEQLSGSRRAELAGLELAAIYAPAVMLPEAARSQRWLVNGLELVRDILIFVPIIYTWWRLSQALEAYNHYTGRAPFLLAWQQGFGHHTQRLSTSALVVASIVLVVVILTFVAHVARTWYDETVLHRQQQLASLLAEATLLLIRTTVSAASDVTKAELAAIGTRITASSISLQEALAKAGKDIASAVDASPGSKLHEMFKKWTAAADELKELGQRLKGTQEMVTQLQATQKALNGMAEKIGQETSRLIDALEKERTVSYQEAHAHHELATEVGRSTEALRDSLQGLQERATDFSAMVHTLGFLVERLESGNSQVGGGYN